MNNKILFIVFLGSILLFSGCKKSYPVIHDYNAWITSHFEIALPFQITEKMVIDVDSVTPPGFVIIKAAEDQINMMLSCNFESYWGWKKYTGNAAIGFGKKTYYISGGKNEIIFNRLMTKHQCDNIEIFIDKKKQLIIFHWGFTSGM